MKKFRISQRLVLLFLVLANFTNSQVHVKMKNFGGVSVIPCKINDVDLEFIFDTGASDVTISLEVASALWKNGRITENDFIGTSNYQVASGEIVEGLVLNLKKVEIGGIIISNVKASILKGSNIPLLLGQSAISRLGTIQLNLNDNTIVINNNQIANSIDNYLGVVIGDQEWMVDNLSVSKFRNGDIIPEAKSKAEWYKAGREGKPVWCYYENNPKTNSKGKLYNWFAVNDPRGLAPKGWRVASLADWDLLEQFLMNRYDKVSFSYIANQLDSYNFDFYSIGVRIANQYVDFSSGEVANNTWWIASPKSKTLYNPDVMIAWNSNNKYFISSGRLRSVGMPVKCVKVKM